MKRETQFSADQARRWRRTLRLTFAYEGAEVRWVGRQSVEMTTPPPATPRPKEGQSGFWYEVRDSPGGLVYYRVAHNPIQIDHEVFSPNPKESIGRLTRKKVQGTFELLVPDLPESATLTIFSSPPDPEKGGESAREIGRFDLKQAPPRKEEAQ